MTNPNDYWRHQQSAAPHAPQHAPLTPGMPLPQDQPAMNIGGGGGEAYPAYAGGGSGVNPWLRVAGAFIVFLFAAPIFISLYPLASAVTVAAYFTLDRVLHAMMPALDDSSRLPFVGIAALVVFWLASRFDHRLAAAVPPYRWIRHAARVLLLAVFITLSTINESGRGGWMPRSAYEIRLLFSDSRFLPVMAVAAVVVHLFLTRAKRARQVWDGALTFFRLRPKSLG